MKNKVLTTLMVVFVSGALFAQSNTATITQTGQATASTNATVDQFGLSNLVQIQQLSAANNVSEVVINQGASAIATAGYFNTAIVDMTAGGNQRVDIQQVGANNLSDVLHLNTNNTSKIRQEDYSYGLTPPVSASLTPNTAVVKLNSVGAALVQGNYQADITQVGSANVANVGMGYSLSGATWTKVFSVGTDNTFVASQTGNSNTLTQTILSASDNTTTLNSGSVTQQGNFNEAVQVVDDATTGNTANSSGNISSINQLADGLATLASHNFASATQNGTNNTYFLTQTGAGNSSTTLQKGTGVGLVVDQNGHGQTFNATQTGTTNVLATQTGETNSNIIIQNGTTLDLTSDQTGTSNAILFNQSGSGNTNQTTQTGLGNNILLDQSGTGNSYVVSQNNGTVNAGNTVGTALQHALQTGTNGVFNALQDGSANAIALNQGGTGNVVMTSQSGNTNSYDITQAGSGNVICGTGATTDPSTQVGDGNILLAVQAAGSMNNRIQIDQAGNLNNSSVTQLGTNGIVTINQGN